MIELTGEFGQRVEQRLKRELVIWLTTIGPDQTPQPRPVWFLWDGRSVLTYSRAGAHKLEHIRQEPNVALNFNSDERGNDVVVLLGTAQVVEGGPPATEVEGYIEKYRRGIEHLGSTPKRFAQDFSQPIRIEPFKLRGH